MLVQKYVTLSLIDARQLVEPRMHRQGEKDAYFGEPSARRGQQSRLVVRTGLPEIRARGTDPAAPSAAPVLGESHRGLHSFLAPPLVTNRTGQMFVLDRDRLAVAVQACAVL